MDLFNRVPPAARLMMMSAMGFSLMSLCVKLAANAGIPLMEILAARSLVSIVLCLWLLQGTGINLLGTNRWLLITRGLVGFVALSMVFYSVTHLPLAEATVLQYLNPLFTALLGLFLLKEPIHKGVIACIALSMVGVLIMTTPGLSITDLRLKYPPLALAAALGGASLSALAYVIVRRLNVTENPLVIVLYFPLVSLPATLPFVIPNFVMPTLESGFYLLLVGLFTQIGQICLTQAMQTESAGKAMSYSYLQVVFAGIWGVIFLAEIPAVATFIGAAFIMTGAWINMVAKNK